MSTLTKYLQSCPGTSNVHAIRVKIGRTTYDGASYVQDGRRRLYLLGDKPPSSIGRNVAYRFDADLCDWYVAAYMPRENLTPENAQYHPCGPNFLLMPWDAPGTIDAHARVPYRRMRATML